MSASKDSLVVDKSTPVLVTGATGYVAGVLISQLLELGVTVHAAVRDPTKTDRHQHLVELAEKSPGSIKFFKGDLMQDGSYKEGMEGCSVVFHTASPFALDVKDPEKDLIQPAEKGTRNVLIQATKTPSVKRVVITSSCAAIYTDSCDTNAAPNQILTEEVWNTTASRTYQPYSLSKTLAEQTAWVIAGSQTQWTMAVINPSMVMGPGTKYHASSESFQMLKTIGDGTLSSGCPLFGIGIVDVRDVARAHIVAAYNHNAKGRQILCGHCTNYVEMANALKPKYAQYPLPNRTVPKWLLWLVGPYVGISRRFVYNNVNIPIMFDNSKSKKELGIEYHSLEKTLQDMFQQLVDKGAVSKS